MPIRLNDPTTPPVPMLRSIDPALPFSRTVIAAFAGAVLAACSASDGIMPRPERDPAAQQAFVDAAPDAAKAAVAAKVAKVRI